MTEERSVSTDQPARYIALIAIALGFVLGAAIYVSTQVALHRATRNSHRIERQVSHLCDDAYLLANFWDGVRKSTQKSLSDPTLSRTQRIVNEEFILELAAGAHAARDTCPGHVFVANRP